MSCKLFFDKFSKNHNYPNEVTKKISFDTLTVENGYTEFTGEKARKLCNSLPKTVSQIPQLDKKLYAISSWKKDNDVYTVIIIDTDVLEEYVKNKKDIPNYNFFRQLVRYNDFYDKAMKSKILFSGILTNGLSSGSLIHGNIHNVVSKVTESSSYKNAKAIKDPEQITMKLFRYQLCSIYWMIEKEKNKKTIHFSTSKEFPLNNVYYDFYKSKFNMRTDRKKLTFHGGAIIDEVGLGKTVQITTLAILHPPKSITYIKKNVKKFHSRATLILCPNHLCGQWKRELKRTINKSYSPVILSLLTKRHFDNLTYQQLLDADFVIMSYTFFDNKAYTSKWVSKEFKIKNYHKSPHFNHETVKKLFAKLGNKLTNDPINSLEQTNPLIQLIHWHRLVIDEFHEIYTNRKYIYIKNMAPHIESTYKWVVTGTPFNDDDNLYHMVDFLTNYQNTDGRQIMVSHDLVEYMCIDCFRRNTKTSVEEEFTLPPYTEEIRFLQFTTTERAMYNAYLANSYHTSSDVYLRQLCCHPNLAEETKSALSNCKSLEDIEKMMLTHYKNQGKKSASKMNIYRNKIKKLNRDIKTRKQDINWNKVMKKIHKDDDLDKIPDEQLVEEYEKESKMTYVYEYPIEPYDEEFDEIDLELMKDPDKEFVDEHNGIINDDLDISSHGLYGLKESLKRATTNYKKEKEVYSGHKSTYTFFNNVIDRLKQTASKKAILKKKAVIPLEGDLIAMLEAGLDDSDDEDEDVCTICLGEIVSGNIGVTRCGHIFCYSCLNDVYQQSVQSHYGEPKCPVCRRVITKNSIFQLSYAKKKEKTDVSPENIRKNELINKVGTKLANLICFLRENNKHTIIFSQWDDLLHKVGKVLSEYKIKNIFCQGNVYQKDKAMREFNENNKTKVIMLSSDSAASGTNLTKAKQIILLDPVYGNYQHRKDTEQQAIGRSHRLGQTEPLKVIRFMIKDSIEEEIFNQNIKEDKKHPEFEGRIIKYQE